MVSLGLSELALLSIFCLEYYYYYKLVNNLNENKLTEKQKTYIISIKNSLIMTLASVFYIYLFINSGFTLNFSKDNTIFGHLIILYFMAYLIMDLAIGIYEYPKSLELLSGYIHHSIYIVISSLALYYNSNVLFIFILAMLEELPTFLLAIGSFDSSLRNDTLFGITFFITRIVYHLFLIFLFRNEMNLVFYITSLALILHVYWFKNWWSKYGKKIKLTLKNKIKKKSKIN